MGLEENKAIVRRVYEVFNSGNMALLDEVCDVSMLMHQGIPGMPPGREGLKAVGAALRSGLPDFHLAIEEIVAEGDTVVVRYSGSGTHKGKFMGVPPTDRTIALQGCEFYRLANGKVVEVRILPDRLSMMQQLGAMPGHGKAK